MYKDDIEEHLLGKMVLSLKADAEKQNILFETADGNFCYSTAGDCCSSSWIEHFEGVQNLIGATISTIEEIDISERPDPTPDKHYCLRIYGYKFITDKGHAVLDFRNDSNGYYGGYIVEGDASIATIPLVADF